MVFDRTAATDADRERFFQLLLGTTDDMVASDLTALLAFVGGDPAAGSGPVGCIGYCIGGRSVLRTIAADPGRFRAGVALHPSRCTTDEHDSPHLGVAGYDGRLYVGFGAEDRAQPPAANRPLIDLVGHLPHGEVEIHDGADHGFAVPGPAFHEAAAARSYERARTIFEAGLRP
jgi:carboxymethylenebutenolidase